MANGIVYILTNEAMPGYTKIGKTADLQARIRSLDTTGIPLPFECFYAAQVDDEEFVERRLHEAFDDHRVRRKREFFQVDPERIRSALEIAGGEDVTPRNDVIEDDEDQAALNAARTKRGNFNFEMVNIPIGAELVFSRDQDVTCIVIDKRRVRFEYEETSLSAAALIAINRLGYNWTKIAGPQYWKYEGETLDERRSRMETGE